MERSSERFIHAACVRVVMEWHAGSAGPTGTQAITPYRAQETHKHGHSPPPSHLHLFTVRVWREDLGQGQTEPLA